MSLTRQDTLAIGAAGKQALMDFFRKHSYIVEDLTDNSGYSKINVDFSLEAEDKKRYVHAITDTRMVFTNNVVIEMLIKRRDIDKIIPGWYYTCKAQLLAYLDANNGDLYMLDWTILREMVADCVIGERKEFYNKIDQNALGQVHIIPRRELLESPAIKLVTHVDTSSLDVFDWERPSPF